MLDADSTTILPPYKAASDVGFLHCHQPLFRSREVDLSARQIASRATIGDYLARHKAAGFSSPLPEGLSDAELERRLFPPVPAVPSAQRPTPDWTWVHAECCAGRISVDWVAGWRGMRTVLTNPTQPRSRPHPCCASGGRFGQQLSRDNYFG